MRVTLFLIFGLIIALTASSIDALRTSSASKTLARLSHRLAAAEAELISLRSSSLIHTQVQPYPTPTWQYTFDYSTYSDKSYSNTGTMYPSTANNIGFSYDASRSGNVVVRSPSKTYVSSILSFPIQLPSSFTLGVWINWNGIYTGTENHVLDSSDGSLQFFLDGNGYYTVVVNGVKQTDPKPATQLNWVFYAIVVDSSAQTFSLFRADKADGNVKIGTVSATYPGTATSLKFGNYGPSPSSTKGWYGYMDMLSIYNYALSDDLEADLWWGTNIGAAPTGMAPTAPGRFGYWGHFDQAQVIFSNRYASQAVGDWSIVFAVRDIDINVGDQIWLRLNACGGKNGTVTYPDGTTITYNVGTKTLGEVIIKPGSVIPQGSVQTYPISGSQIQVTNPTLGNSATSSDAKWQIGILFSSSHISQPGIHYECIKNTPATLNPNPSML